jgi:hypothetical protein
LHNDGKGARQVTDLEEALKAASLDDICRELERKSSLCFAMALDCVRFAEHEDDPLRRLEFYDKRNAFTAKAEVYRDMAKIGRGK